MFQILDFLSIILENKSSKAEQILDDEILLNWIIQLEENFAGASADLKV